MATTPQETVTLEYPAILAALNTRVSRRRLQPGEVSLGVGVDGRTTGALLKFPGFKQLRNLGLTGVSWAKYVSMTKGNTQYTLRGFVVLHNVTGTYTLTFHYYDSQTAAWSSQNLTTSSALAADSIVDCDGNGKFLYVTVYGQAPRSVYYDTGTSAFVQEVMGVSTYYTAPDNPDTITSAGTGGNLSNGTYLVGYRYYDSVRRVFSAMASTTKTLSGGTTTQLITMNNTGGHASNTPYTDGYDQIYIYRSLSASVADSTYDAGILWNESIQTISSNTWSFTVGTLADLSLIQQDPYDPTLDSVGVPPSSGAIGTYEGVTVMGADSSATSVVTELRFSPLNAFYPEQFPLDNIFRWSIDDGPMIRFVRCGDQLYGWTKTAAYRISKVGNQMAITRVNAGRGLTNRAAVTSIGKDMLAMTQGGLMLVDSTQGAMQAVGATTGRTEEWRDDLATVFIATDYSMGCTFVVNATTYDALVLWHLTGAVTELEDCRFVAGCEGPDPTTGEDMRAWFITSTGRVFYAHDDAGYSMYGLDEAAVTVNGQATGGSSSTLIDTSAVGWTTAALSGAMVYVWESDDDPLDTPQALPIASVSGTTITVTGTFTTAPVAGCRYAIAPVPWKVRQWPMKHPDASLQDFGRRVVNLMGVMAVSYAGASDPDTNPNAKWRVGMCRNLEATPAAAAYSDFEDDLAGTDGYQPVAVDGLILEPYIEQIAANTGFSLLSVLVTGRITLNRQSG